MKNNEVFVVILGESGYGAMESHLHATLEGAQAKARALMSSPHRCLVPSDWDEEDFDHCGLEGRPEIQGWRCDCDYIEILKKEIGE
tara:strand:- start:5484 stop:5741 length:258 start_codon:yes stop_codon:yes gene_type:complete